MKNLLFTLFIVLLINGIAFSQATLPLYIKFEANNENIHKGENKGFNATDNFPNEDRYYCLEPLVGGFPLRMTTHNKRDFTIINQSELANYNVKTIEEIRGMMASKTETEQLNFWGPLHEQKKLYIIELLPDGKAKIVKVWIEPY